MASSLFIAKRKALIENEPSGNLNARLNEKGVECAILVPLLEHQLGYNPLLDIQYELSSDVRNGQRFDFVVDDKLVIEAKALGINLDSKVEQQIVDYIGHNKKLICGILSNGWEYSVYISKAYIERKQNDDESIGLNFGAAVKAFSIQITDDRFLEIMELFGKSDFDQNLSKIAKYVKLNILPVQGSSVKICADKEADEYLKRLIDNATTQVRGYYFDKVRIGDLQAGTKLLYSSRELDISVIVQNDGTVMLPKDGIQIRDMAKVKELFKELPKLYVNEWMEKDTILESPYDIIIRSLGRKNKISGMEKQYPFA